MKKILYFLCISWIISVILFGQNVFANNFLSQSHSNESSCLEDKKTNDSLYPGYSRSNCFEVAEKYFYNICQWNYCPVPQNYITEGWVQNSKQIEELSKILESKLEWLESDKVVDWSENFWDILAKLKNKYKNNKKSVALLEDIQKEFENISQKQIAQNSLCKDTYGRGWQEAEEYFETINTISWYENNQEIKIACEYYIKPEERKDDLDDLVQSHDNGKINGTISGNIFKLESSTLQNYLNKIILNFEFSDEIWDRNILVRNYSMYEYQEKYLKDFNEWKYSQKEFQFSDVSHNVLGIWFTNNEYYTLEIFDEDNNKILAQYKFKYKDDSQQKDLAPSYPIRNLFDGNKNRWENYMDLLEKTSKKDLHNFFKTAEAEMKSKIKETNDFIYFNDTYAITTKKYYGNQIYSTRVCPNNSKMCSNGDELSSICPVWYKLEHDTIRDNPYERQLIWYYLNNNKAKFFQHSNPNGVLWSNLIATPLWVWDKFDEYYVRKVDLEKIKAESQTRQFMNREFVFVNPGHSLNNLSLYNKYHYWTDYGSSYKLWTKISALCEKKNGKINTPNDKELFDKKLSWVIHVQEDVIMKESHYEWGYPLLLSYAYLKLKWYFDENTTFFKPYKKEFNSPYLYFAAKE